jgi:ribosome-binding factor A|tara:strand:+ start:2100 stop:2459 length:360 start_codon:yes stop_codon:yes gene_type:complete
LETQRQKKVSALLLKDFSNIIQSFFREKTRLNFLISVTKVKVSADLSSAKIFISVFPSSNANKACEMLEKNLFEIKKRLSYLVKNQLRIIPSIQFFVDDSLDYIDGIENAIKKGENPIK